MKQGSRTRQLAKKARRCFAARSIPSARVHHIRTHSGDCVARGWRLKHHDGSTVCRIGRLADWLHVELAQAASRQVGFFCVCVRDRTWVSKVGLLTCLPIAINALTDMYAPHQSLMTRDAATAAARRRSDLEPNRNARSPARDRRRLPHVLYLCVIMCVCKKKKKKKFLPPVHYSRRLQTRWPPGLNVRCSSLTALSPPC
ncbi:uncharacterized protein IWZ02DRAFT_264363 [Phyllosticta citriasiana]|uniref:uncharacterized protein n=1 Tax=Phyllosticta citriasiana TaxID=595635 RepID=UPI0030FDB344